MIAACPVTVVIDDREKAPYCFAGLGDVSLVHQRLLTGDYSLPFLSDKVCVSRKSLRDLYATALDPARSARFEAELSRMASMTYALVVVEGDLDGDPPPPGFTFSQKKVVQRQVGRWWQPLRWEMAEGRRMGEITTLSFLVTAREDLVRRGLA